MDEFLKLSWRIKAPSDLENQIIFLPEEVVSESYIYKNFVQPIKANVKKKVKLNISSEKYVPGKQCYKTVNRRSLLTKNQKKNCLAAMKVLQSGKNPETMTASEKFAIQIYKECHQNIVEENQKFLEFTRNIWEKNASRPVNIRPAILNYSRYHWRQGVRRYLDYPKFYKEVSMISLSYNESDGSVNFNHILNALEMGTLARFSQPNLKEMCKLKMITLPQSDDTKTYNSKLPVSEDENISNLLKSHKIDVVISSSALKQIIDYTDTKSKWTIPVVIKEVSTVDNLKKKVVFIDKVLPKTNPNYYDLKYYACKQLVKTNVCQYEAFTFPTEEKPVLLNNDNDDDIFEEKPEENVDEKITKKGRQRVIHHNVSYRVWKIQKIGTQCNLMKNKTEDTEINLLVRCKLDACECTEQGILQPAIVKPKLEQQSQYGANIPSKSELAREWTSLFFRLYSNLYRVRLYVPFTEVISIEKCTLQKINTEASSYYDYKPLLGLGVLQKIMQELTNLDTGNYILHHLPKHENFVSVMKHCEDKTENCYDLHSEFDRFQIDSDGKMPWLPIDTNYILPVHEDLDQMPAMFQGFDKLKEGIVTRTSPRTKKKKKKKKNKGIK